MNPPFLLGEVELPTKFLKSEGLVGFEFSEVIATKVVAVFTKI